MLVSTDGNNIILITYEMIVCACVCLCPLHYLFISLPPPLQDMEALALSLFLSSHINTKVVCDGIN